MTELGQTTRAAAPSAVGEHRAFLARLFDAAVAAADPARVIGGFLPQPVPGRTVIVGAGKASAAMAAAFEAAWTEAGNGAIEGLVVTRYGHAHACRHIEIVEAAHPVPDDRGTDAARRILELASQLGPDDQMVALISGGGSSLLSLPPAAVGIQVKRGVNKALLRSGASIREMNCVRKQLSTVKGGRLAAAAHPARVVSLVLSDIPGDDASLVASGPTLPDETTQADALDVIERHRIDLPDAALAWLRSPDAAAPRPTAASFGRDTCHVIGTAQAALAAAADMARSCGVAAHILSDSVEGEAYQAGFFHAAIVRQVVEHGQPFARPCVLLSGGETTVTVRGDGRGGRNAEFLLAFATGIAGLKDVSALAADTDGIDGSEDNAGAFCDGATSFELMQAGINPQKALCRNDSYAAFHRIGALFITGPTRTNVNDFRAVLIA